MSLCQSNATIHESTKIPGALCVHAITQSPSVVYYQMVSGCVRFLTMVRKAITCFDHSSPSCIKMPMVDGSSPPMPGRCLAAGSRREIPQQVCFMWSKAFPLTRKLASWMACYTKSASSRERWKYVIKMPRMIQPSLMAPVHPVTTYTFYNIDKVKLEHLLHKLFSDARLSIEITDRFGKKVKLREWFLVTVEVIGEAITRFGPHYIAYRNLPKEWSFYHTSRL